MIRNVSHSFFFKYLKNLRQKRRIRIESNRRKPRGRRYAGMEGKRKEKSCVYMYIYIYKREEAAPRTVAGWQAKGAAKLKFLRSSDDAATHKKFKRFILVGGPRRASLAFFPI